MCLTVDFLAEENYEYTYDNDFQEFCLAADSWK